jgi:hypothetical protein
MADYGPLLKTGSGLGQNVWIDALIVRPCVRDFLFECPGRSDGVGTEDVLQADCPGIVARLWTRPVERSLERLRDRPGPD